MRQNSEITMKIILTLLSLLSLVACTNTQYGPPTAAETAAAARSVQVLNNAPANSAPVQYASRVSNVSRTSAVGSTISPQDTLDVSVFKVPDLSLKQIKVESSGIISMPLIGSVKVTGLSISQAEQRITQRLKQYMQDPKVSITRTDQALSKRVTVEGEVKTPGVFSIKGNLSFLQAIAMAQGLSEVADSRKVLFYRDGGQHIVNLDLVRTGRIADPGLRGDDRIVVLKDPAKVKEKKMLEYIPVLTAPISLLPGL